MRVRFAFVLIGLSAAAAAGAENRPESERPGAGVVEFRGNRPSRHTNTWDGATAFTEGSRTHGRIEFRGGSALGGDQRLGGRTVTRDSKSKDRLQFTGNEPKKYPDGWLDVATATLDSKTVGREQIRGSDASRGDPETTFTQHDKTPGRIEVRGNEPRRLNQGTETVVTATRVSKAPARVDPRADERTATTRTFTKNSRTPDRLEFRATGETRHAGRWDGVRTMRNDRKRSESDVATVRGDTAAERIRATKGTTR